MTSIPSKAQIVVIGGGPGGSYGASLLAREGFEVVLLEASKFPRYHIGESMLPSIREFLRFNGCEQKVLDHGFTKKPGAAVKFNQWKKEGYTDFVALDPNNVAWNVVRSEFDDILLKHAGELGATIFQETKVTSINFDTSSGSPSPVGRPVSAEYTKADGTKGTIAFDYLVDASGRNGIMSTKYLRNRRMNASLKNIACWGYWENGSIYMPGTSRHNAPYFECLTDESGWAWFIPLHNGTVSVGLVMSADMSASKKRAGAEKAAKTGGTYTLKDHYLEDLYKYAPTLIKLLEDAKLVHKPQGVEEDDGSKGLVKSAADFSYAATSYAGDHFRLVGDAAAFIDPFFSSGVHLACTGGLSAAASIASSIRGEIDEASAVKYHDEKIGIAYTRFLLVVMGVYKQIRSQNSPILSDVDEDNFDRAFNIIRPVIQGAVDVGKKLSEDELHKTMDFCRHVFAPTDPQMHTAVGARVNSDMFSPDGPIMTPDEVDAAVEDDEARHVLKEVNARKPIHTMYKPTGNFEREVVAGLKVRCEAGSLGLVRA